MSALDKITPMFLANAAFCIENGSEVKPETRESIIDTLIKASEELSQANEAKLAPTQGADARPVAIHYPDCWDTAAYPTFESALAEVYEWFHCSECATRDAAPSENEKRYLWLREQHWNESSMAVVCEPKKAVRLGYDCPSDQRLDEIIDAAIESQRTETGESNG